MAFSTPPDDDSRSAKGIILDDCVTAETAAALTGYNIQHIRRLAYDGKLEAVRVGGVSAVASIPLGLPTPGATNGLLLLNSAQFALTHVPAFAANGAQNATLGNLLAKSLQQLFGAFAGSTYYLYQSVSPPQLMALDSPLCLGMRPFRPARPGRKSVTG
jgi:hypothetical protein